jgi:hypothetical protein
MAHDLQKGLIGSPGVLYGGLMGNEVDNEPRHFQVGVTGALLRDPDLLVARPALQVRNVDVTCAHAPV